MSKTNFEIRSTTSTQIYLNSLNADIFMNTTMKSKLVWFFNSSIQIPKNGIETKLSIVNAQIPISWYLINDTNNKIIINDITYYFKNGNYNINTFISEWSNSIGSGWTLTYDGITNKITYAFTSNFTFADSTFSIFPIIGFKSSTLYTSLNNSLVSPFCCNFAGLTRLRMRSTILNMGNVDSLNGKNTTLCVIPVNSIGSGYILYQNLTAHNNIIKTQEITSIDLELVDDMEYYVDLNNCDWSCTLQIDVITETIQSIDNIHDIYANQSQEF